MSACEHGFRPQNECTLCNPTTTDEKLAALEARVDVLEGQVQRALDALDLP